jgi:hypothetical protein
MRFAPAPRSSLARPADFPLDAMDGAFKRANSVMPQRPGASFDMVHTALKLARERLHSPFWSADASEDEPLSKMPSDLEDA